MREKAPELTFWRLADASEDESGPTTTTTAPIVPVVPKKSSKWADEDAEDDVADDWEASSSDGENKKNAASTGPPKPIRNKGVTRQKIAEKEAQEAQERAAAEAAAEEEADPVARKAREQKRTLDADMENARGLFGDASISTGSSPVFGLRLTFVGVDAYQALGW